MHFKCDETSGLYIEDEVAGFRLQPYQLPDFPDGSLSFDGPQYSIGRDPAGATPPTVNGGWPTILGSKFHMLLMVLRSRDTGGLPSGSCSMNGEFAFGSRQGMHLTVTDNASFTASVSPDANKKVTTGNDYVFTTLLRPYGGNYGLDIYNLDGTIATDSVSSQNLSISTAVPSAPPDITPTAIDGGAYQSDWYQKILYRFDTEPSAAILAHIVKWHGATAPTGIKSPCPIVKGLT